MSAGSTSEAAIDVAATRLAREHAVVDAPPPPMPIWRDLAAARGWVAKARSALADPERVAAKAAEWLLDNEYVVHRALNQVEEDLPSGFYRELPALEVEGEESIPRIVGVARAILDASRLQLTHSTSIRFVEVYQRDATLETAELWALPTALRLVCLEVLVGALARLVPPLEPSFELGWLPGRSLDDTECVARAIGNLRVVDEIAWTDFFTATSRVEAILREDPAECYAQVDFETADRYRRVVERLSRSTHHPETEIAERVVAYARRYLPLDRRRVHVGYWLIGEGRRDFQRAVGHRPGACERLLDLAARHAAGGYLASLAAATLLALALPALYLAASGATTALLLLGLAVAALPASVLGVTLVHWAVTHLAPPNVLPKLDLKRGIPMEYRTAVVVPCLVGSPQQARRMVERLEGHYLGSPESALEFVLLSDGPDSDNEHLPEDEAIREILTEGISLLNRRHAGGGAGPFHVLHRARVYNESEGCWMGWERKRGKLEDFNRLLQGDPNPAFTLHEGDRERLRGIAFVVTLDADTILPRGAVGRLVGILAHPLNRARFDDETGRVLDGYTVVQPRVEIEPTSGNRSRFARLFAGDTAIDIYSRAVSDVYQDLFGSGIYVGKGIYDVAAFMRSLEGRVPENAIASHDLFEGLHGRVALATDVVLYESFPTRYLEFTRRLHRWVRGDWQLLPWLLPTVPTQYGRRVPNRLSHLDRFKIFDNLRRSLVAPSLIVMLVAGWAVLPGSPWFWTVLGLLAPAGHLFTDLVTGFARGRRRSAVQATLRRFVDHAGRWLLLIAFLPHEAWVSVDAIGRTLSRVFVTRRRLLEWTTAEHTALAFANATGHLVEWRAMMAGPVVGVAVGATLAILRPEALPSAIVLLAAWCASPEIAFRLGLPTTEPEHTLEPDERRFLRALARRTWLFFETFAGSEDQWLPPDNYQEDPGSVVAHRTSPTNIGMMLLSVVTANDLGFLGVRELRSRLGGIFETLGRLERYRGHPLNWYDTRTLEPLPPRYVSTVDSGNLVASLVALKEALLDRAAAAPFRPERWDGLVDLLALLEEDVARVGSDVHRGQLADRLRSMEHRAERAKRDPSSWVATLDDLANGQGRRFEDALREALDAADGDLQGHVLRDIRVWLDRFHHQVAEMRRELDTFAPWLALAEESPEFVRAEMEGLLVALANDSDERALEARVAEVRRRLAAVDAARSADDDGDGEGGEVLPWLDRFAEAFDAGERERAALSETLRALAQVAEREVLAIDFGWLYDESMRLFHIGYNVDADRLDGHHYDLLASEARIASFMAIAKGDVPLEHWFHLGRGITEVSNRHCLVSWGGSMFEYLMPSLLLRSEPTTLLAQSERAAVTAQRRFARSHGVPWGVSESGFASIDADRNYRYRAFGVPGLGLRRDLADDLVVAPYASVLALGADAAAACENLRRLAALGMVGEYGLFEAVDFTPERLPEGRGHVTVRSYMAHHQGMVLAALGNALCDEALVRRMHSDRRVRSVELVLHERVPMERSREVLPRAARPTPRPAADRLPEAAPWTPRGVSGAALHLLGNGRLFSAITDTGDGGLRWQDYALTRWHPDPTCSLHGIRIHVKDEESGERWSSFPEAGAMNRASRSVLFHGHLAEYHRVDHGLGLRTEVMVVPGDDVEVRRLTLVNESDHPRRVSLTSHAEIVLASERDDARHPAFSKLFVRSEWVSRPAGLLFTRRPRGPEERPPVLMHRVVADSPRVELLGYESDRRTFVGRGRYADDPVGQVRSAPESTGFTLDAIASICVGIELPPRGVESVAFLTLAGASRAALLEAAERYETPEAIGWVIADAAIDARRQLERLHVDPELLPVLQELASRLVHPVRHDPGRTALVRENRLGQPRLWGMGLSGDLPILLVTTDDPTAVGLVEELVLAHRYWRENGLSIDLVVLSEVASGYTEPVGDSLLGVLSAHGEREQLGRRGGIHYLTADQLGVDDRRLLEAFSRARFDARGGSLEAQLAAQSMPVEEPPRFIPSRSDGEKELSSVLASTVALAFENGFGGFSSDGAYMIRLPAGSSTPAPWANVLANATFGTLVTESGGGFTWSINSGENRLSPWSNDPVGDRGGEAIYLRDEETGAVWSPTPAPAGGDIDFEIRHEPGETRWRARAEGLDQTLAVVVPPEDSVKVLQLTLRNEWARPRRLTATYFVEWVLGTNRRESRWLLAPHYDPELHTLFARNPWNPEFAERVAFLASSEVAHGVSADREAFLGRGGTMSNPAALERWGLSGGVEACGDPCGALQVHLELTPGESRVMHFVIGQGADQGQAEMLARRWRRPDEAAAAFRASRAFWDELLGAVRVRTPDPATDLMLNRWLLYQTVASRLFARSGFYQSGGAFGFRDQLQDSLCLVHSAPEQLRAHLLECAKRQFEEGDVLHWWHEPSGRGVRTRCSDDLLWLPFAAAAYVEATGDRSVLDEEVPYSTGSPLDPGERERYATFPLSERSATLFEHCARALERGVTSGPNGLPLMGAGDWNDGMDRVGGRGNGESIWLGWFAIATIRGFVLLCDRRGETALADHWRRRRTEIEAAIEASGWDGEWYRRAIDDDGRFWGSKESEECCIDSIAQSWAVLSGSAPEPRARAAVRAAEAALVDSEHDLVRLLTPPFDATLREPGYIKSYPPGVRENGGQYSHAAAWLGLALAGLGDADGAWRIFRAMNPIEHARDAEAAARFRVEPYVLAADVAGAEPLTGRGGWTWYTGAAAWMWRLGIEGLLGIHRVEGGVRIAPRLPSDWEHAEVSLQMPGSGVIEIEIDDPLVARDRPFEVEVDGVRLSDGVVWSPPSGVKRVVRVSRGAEPAPVESSPVEGPCSEPSR